MALDCLEKWSEMPGKCLEIALNLGLHATGGPQIDVYQDTIKEN
jgi:hypothetical protein